MFKKVLVPVALDHLDVLPAQIASARQILAKGGIITALSVLEDLPSYVAEYAIVQRDPKELLRSAQEALWSALKDHPEIACNVGTGKPGVAIVEAANKMGADLIVLAARRPGSDAYALGSTTSRISRRAACSVLILR